MIQCNNCGQGNVYESNFCRFCGKKLHPSPSAQFIPQPRNANGNNYDQAPAPPPHIWKTDEFQISDSKARRTETIDRVKPMAQLNVPNQYPPGNQALAHQQTHPVAFGYRCPRCASQLLPKIERKISPVGWVTFAVLIVTFFPLFWIGFLIKEDVRICPVCNLKIT